MGFLFLMIFTASFMWIMNWISKSKDQPNRDKIKTPPEKRESWKGLNSKSYSIARPTFHPESLIKFAPYALFLLIPIVLTVFIAQDVLAILLMVFGVFIVGGITFYLLNLREHLRHEESKKNELVVEESRAVIDDFIIPEEWSRDLL